MSRLKSLLTLWWVY